MFKVIAGNLSCGMSVCGSRDLGKDHGDGRSPNASGHDSSQQGTIGRMLSLLVCVISLRWYALRTSYFSRFEAGVPGRKLGDFGPISDFRFRAISGDFVGHS